MTAPSPAKVAVIEDDAPIAKMYCLKLRQEGFEVQMAGNAEDGLDLIKTFQPNVVVLDIMMPDSNGVDFLAALRRFAANDAVKVLVLTNLDDPKLKKSLAGFKISDYLLKTDITPADLAAKVKAAAGS